MGGGLAWRSALAVGLGLVLLVRAQVEQVSPVLPDSYTWEALNVNTAEDVYYVYTLQVDSVRGWWQLNSLRKPSTPGGPGAWGNRLVSGPNGKIYYMSSTNGTNGGWDCWAGTTPIPIPNFDFSPFSTVNKIVYQNKTRYLVEIKVDGYNWPSTPMVGQTAVKIGYLLHQLPSGKWAIDSRSNSLDVWASANTISFTEGAPPPSDFNIPESCSWSKSSSASAPAPFVDPFGSPSTLLARLKEFTNHNLEKHSYTLGPNAFSHLSPSQLEARFPPLATKSELEQLEGTELVYQRVTPEGELPASIDWREKGYVTSVRDQGYCGGCWSFASAALFETITAKKQQKRVEHLAMQQLLDCARFCNNTAGCLFPAKGCHGAWPTRAFQYAYDHGGLAAEKNYQFAGVEGACSNDPKVIPVTPFQIANYTKIPEEDLIADAIANYGAALLIVDITAWKAYTGGVFDLPSCGNRPAHAVTAVGYGHDEASGKDYWLIKNSFGRAWGEGGYIRMVRGKNMCGLANWPYAVALKD